MKDGRFTGCFNMFFHRQWGVTYCTNISSSFWWINHCITNGDETVPSLATIFFLILVTFSLGCAMIKLRLHGKKFVLKPVCSQSMKMEPSPHITIYTHHIIWAGKWANCIHLPFSLSCVSSETHTLYTNGGPLCQVFLAETVETGTKNHRVIDATHV